MVIKSGEHVTYKSSMGKPESIPPPVKIEHIILDKVYVECKQVDVNKIEFEIDDIEDIQIENEIIDIECISVELIKKKCEKINNNRIRLWIVYEVNFRVDGEIFTEIEMFEKTVTFSTQIINKLNPSCEVFLECLDAFALNKDTIIIYIGKLLLFKLVKRVQLLVPAYGFAPQPENCNVVGEYLDYEPVWPPYPEQ